MTIGNITFEKAKRMPENVIQTEFKLRFEKLKELGMSKEEAAEFISSCANLGAALNDLWLEKKTQ